MTLKARRFLFYSLAVLFLILGVIIIFYSNGWRFDLGSFSISKLGAIYFKQLPDNAKITIEKTDFKFDPGLLNSSLLIANLFPKTYRVQINKTGYQSWNKELKVKPSLVTEVPQVILMPEKLNLGLPLAKQILDFWVGPQYLITLSQNQRLEFQSKPIFGEKVIAWSENGSVAITQKDSSYFLIDLKKTDSAINLNLIFNNLAKPLKTGYLAIEKISFQPNNNNQLIIQSDKGIYLLNFKNSNLLAIQKGEIETFAAANNELFFSAPDGVFAYNFDLNSKKSIFTEDSITDIQISESSDYLSLLTDSHKLFLIEEKSGRQQIIADNAVRVKFSPDSQKIAFTTEKKEVVIYNLNSENQKPATQAAILNIGIAEDNEIIWHKDSEYLFIKYPLGLYLLEGNNLPPINFQVIDSENSKYSYQPEENALYLLKKDSLYSFDLE